MALALDTEVVLCFNCVWNRPLFRLIWSSSCTFHFSSKTAVQLACCSFCIGQFGLILSWVFGPASPTQSSHFSIHLQRAGSWTMGPIPFSLWPLYFVSFTVGYLRRAGLVLESLDIRLPKTSLGPVHHLPTPQLMATCRPILDRTSAIRHCTTSAFTQSRHPTSR